MLKKLDYRFKYLLSLFLVILITVTVGFLLHKSHAKRIYGMPKTKTTDTVQTVQLPQNIEISSAGSNKRTMDLHEGLVDFNIDYSGNSKIIVNVLDGNERPVAYVIEHFGPCIRKRTVFVPEAGEYILDVRCEGKWSVSAR